MKRITAIIIMSLISTPLLAENPKTQNNVMGGVSIVGGAVSIGLGAAYTTAAAAAPAGSGALLAAQAAAAYVAGAGQIVAGGFALANAENLGGGNGVGGVSFDAPSMPTSNIPASPSKGGGISNTSPYTPGKVNQLRDLALAKQAEVKSSLEDFLGQNGPTIEELAAHPENYLSPEELAKLNDAKEKMKDEIESKTSEEMLKEFGNSNANMADASSVPGFNFEDLMAQMNGMNGLNNPVEGYYGNVRLGMLKPDSKQSLFERVSVRIKKVM